MWSSAWRCDWHGEVHPLLPAFSPSKDGLDGLLRTAGVPVWLPWPLPVGWLVTGFAGAGDERTGVRACAVALSGPNPLGGPADMMVVAEEPGVGLGAALARLDGVDPGAGFCAAPPVATASFGNNHFPLWPVDSKDRAVFAGEVKGLWLWLVLWPDTAGALLVEPIGLRDLGTPARTWTCPSEPFLRVCPPLDAGRPACAQQCLGRNRPARRGDAPRRAGRPGRGGADRPRHGGRPCRGPPGPGGFTARLADPAAGHGAVLPPRGPKRAPAGLPVRRRPPGPGRRTQPHPGRPGAARAGHGKPLADLGVGISWDQVAAIACPAVVGRPHIARAMAASGAIATPREAFTRDWIGDGGRAYVGRYALDPVYAIRLVRGAGGVAVLAHPRAGRDWVVSDEEIGRLAAAGLAGVEVFHPDQSDTERAGLLALAHDLGLVATGGSDDHGSLTGHRIGCETVSADAYQALISRATGPGRQAVGI